MDVKAAKYASSRTGALYTLFTCLFREQNVWMTSFSLSLSLSLSPAQDIQISWSEKILALSW
jgi:hypothetical protein